MSYIKCPYCNHSDGNDDIVIDKKIIDMDNTSCEIIVTKECDICGKHYNVKRIFNLDYEQLDIEDEF